MERLTRACEAVWSDAALAPEARWGKAVEAVLKAETARAGGVFDAGPPAHAFVGERLRVVEKSVLAALPKLLSRASAPARGSGRGGGGLVLANPANEGMERHRAALLRMNEAYEAEIAGWTAAAAAAGLERVQPDHGDLGESAAPYVREAMQEAEEAEQAMRLASELEERVAQLASTARKRVDEAQTELDRVSADVGVLVATIRREAFAGLEPDRPQMLVQALTKAPPSPSALAPGQNQS